jgi:hypothetical protein
MVLIQPKETQAHRPIRCDSNLPNLVGRMAVERMVKSPSDDFVTRTFLAVVGFVGAWGGISGKD